MIKLTKNTMIILGVGIIAAIVISAYPYITAIAEYTGVCGIQECHGLEITCGPDVPDACTEIYKLGDFCREFAKCEVIEGECTFAPDTFFQRCKDCTDNCNKMTFGDEAFVCEDYCRELYL